MRFPFSLLFLGLLFLLPRNHGAAPSAPGGGPGGVITQEQNSFIQQNEIKESLAWYDSLENALGVAKEEYRPVLVFFHSPTDGWSNRMRAQVFSDEAVRREMEHYVRVEVSIEDNQETAGNYMVRGIPSIRILSAEGRVLQGRDGFINTPELVRMLRASLNAEFLKKSDPEFQKLVTSLENNKVADDAWPGVMVHLGEPQKRETLRQLILQLDPFPREPFVELLSDERLAVRLGSLELLEEVAGNDFGFDPWKADPNTPENQAALSSWSAWLEASEGQGISEVFSVLSEDQISNYIRDMIGENRERSLRAKSMLRNGGDNVAKALRNFLRHNEDLPPNAKNRVRELFYALTVPSIQGSDPDTVAQRLIYGNLDAKLEAIAALKEMGRPSLPVLLDFLEDPDPLIRETTIDAVLTAGMSFSVPAVEQHLEQEKDSAVILSALRAIGVNEIRGASSLVAKYADDEEEDLAVMALEALGALRATDQSEVIGKQLEDERWRVRVAALETIGRLKSASFGPKIRPLLYDDDEFVRAATVQTIAAIGDNGARDDLLKLYRENEEIRGPVINALLSMRQSLPDSLRDDLAKSQPETILAVIDAVGNSRSRDLTVVEPFLNHEDLDVACASIRLVARYGMSRMDYQRSIAAVLKEGQPEKASSALESLRLDLSQFRRFESRRASGRSDSGIPPEVQEIYDVLLERTPSGDPNQDRSRDPLIAMFKEAETYLDHDNESLRQNAALLLAKAGLPTAIQILDEGLPTRTISQRKTVAAALDNASDGAMPLLITLMRDPSEEVRTAASSSMLEHTNDRDFITAFYDELTRPASPLQPQDVYIGYLRSAVRSGTTKEVANSYAKEILDSSIRPSLLSFAALTLRYAWKYGDEESLLPLTDSEHPGVRRAAWFAIGRNDEKLLQPHFEKIINDPSEKVRAILPYILGKEDGYVIHYYDDEHSQRFSDYLDHSFDTGRSRLDDGAIAALQTLSQDSSPIVRIDSSFVLMANGKQPDPAFLESTLSAFPDRDSIQRKVSDYLEENYMKLPQDYRFLVHHIDPNRVGSSEVELIYSHFQFSADGERADENLSWLPKQDDPLDPEATLPGNQGEISTPPSEDKTIELVYFHNPGCKECDRVREHLNELEAAFPRLRVVSHNMRDSDSARLNEALSERFKVPERIRMVAPAVFSGDGYLIKDEIFPTKLGNLIVESSASGNSGEGWSALEEAEIASASSAIESRFSSVGIAVILSAGFLDGINPCAFATIILFLSYLQIARHGPRQILAVGLSFISAVFLTYFALGLGLVELVTRLQFLKGVGIALNIGLAAFALVIMFYSLRDGVLCLQGRLADTTLQLPAFLKDRIRKVARKGARHHRYVIAAFASGVVISVLELACTGQVYLPTINYMVQEGKSSAYGLLLIYNLAFVFPLIVIFILAFYGLRSEALIAFQNKHSALIKFATAGLFLALFILLLYQIFR